MPAQSPAEPPAPPRLTALMPLASVPVVLMLPLRETETAAA